LVLINQWA